MFVHNQVLAEGCVVCCVDTMNGGIWLELVGLQDLELCQLAKLLPSTVLGGMVRYHISQVRLHFSAMEGMGIALHESICVSNQ